MIENETRFKPGDMVYAKVDAEVKLIIRKYYAGIYYCSFLDEPDKKELALFEREII